MEGQAAPPGTSGLGLVEHVVSGEIVLQGEVVSNGGVNGTPLSQERMVKKRKRMDKQTVTTRWACPREANHNGKGPATPVVDCSKCGGLGCQMEVFMGTAPAEEFVFVTERTEKFNKYMCKACGDSFFGTRSRIVSHKLRIAGRGVATCSVEPSEEAKRILGPLEQEILSKQGTLKEKKSTEIKKNDPGEKSRQKNRDEADMAVARFFYECEVPLAYADHPAFLKMAASLAACEEGYVPPGQFRIADNTPGKSGDARDLGAKPPGLLWACTKAVKKEQEDFIASTSLVGSTLASDGSRNFAGSKAVSHVLWTPKGKVFVSTSEAGPKAQERAAEFLADEAVAAVRKVGELAKVADLAVFLLVMDGPSVCVQALQLVQRTFPRLHVMRSAAFGWDMVLCEIGRRFAKEVVAPVHSMLLHITNHPNLYSVYERLDGNKYLLQQADSRLSIEVMCVRAFYADKNVIKLLWGHPSVGQWLDERDPMRTGVRNRHSQLGLDYVHKPDWWRLLEASVALMECAVPVLREASLSLPNLWKLPSLFDHACAEVQGPLVIAGQHVDTTGLVTDGACVAGRSGDGSVQGTILDFLRAHRDVMVSEVALAAAMVYPPFVFNEPYAYEPEGGRAAFNSVAQRHFQHNEDAHVAVLTAFTMLRNKTNVFASMEAKHMAMAGDPPSFFTKLCVESELRPLCDLALNLLHGVGTLGASDRGSHVIPGGPREERAEQQTQVRMHYHLKHSREYSSVRSRGVMFEVRQHWVAARLAHKRGELGAHGGADSDVGADGLEGMRLQLSDVISDEEASFLDLDVPSDVW